MPLGAADEFRDLVKALHRAGLEVILDVVYNHTAESGLDGPTFCFRGLANEEYYLLDGRGGYADYSGTGNSLDANAAVVRRLIVDSLRFWVSEMHVDGFRFDLASVLSRDEDGRPLARPPILWDIDSDPVLSGTKLIAEAWDAAGLYQVGSFVGDRWVEWNGRFRDDVRAFVRSDPGRVWAVSQRLIGSPDLYAHADREAQKSVNFVTCHDGFTLADLVSYDRKHNEANGEDNRDGTNDNLSWNGGAEGADRRPRHPRASPPPGEEPPRADPARRRRADADDGRRGPAQPGREQQRLLPGQRAQLVRLVGRRARGRHAAVHRVPDRGAPARPGAPRPADRRDAGGAARNGGHRLAWRGAGPAGSLARLAQPGSHDQRPIGGAPHHRQRLLGAARLRAPGSRGRARLAAHPRHDAPHPPTTSASARRPRPSRQPPTGWVRAPSWSSPPGPPSPRRPTRDHPDDAARSGARADGRPRPPRGGSRWREPVVPVGSLRGRAGVGHGARGLQRRRRRVVVFPARSRPFAGLPLERGRDGRAVRRVRADVPRAGAVERPRPDPQGADVRPREQRGQPRRGRQGLLVVPRRAAVERLAALALPLPAGRVPVRRARPRQSRTLEARGRVRAARHGRVRRRLLGGRGRLREGRPDRHPDADQDQERGARGRYAPRPADALVPQHVVVGRRHATAVDHRDRSGPLVVRHAPGARGLRARRRIRS